MIDGPSKEQLSRERAAGQAMLGLRIQLGNTTPSQSRASEFRENRSPQVKGCRSSWPHPGVGRPWRRTGCQNGAGYISRDQE